ncbi:MULTISPECIES: aminotransferase class IV [Paracoccus]|uniref:aminotransferase class IV n=1 Tax=Paracoccus TaxID=265 RepID=UPI0008E8102A|nr:MULTISPECIES: aminotransferase class IV [Paracoccus]MDF3856457.1 aminotransferase class IV [Paracoccus pantotrophus]WGR62247.1 aminotransferase class IV [Paracoccus ferrooxidans]SFP14707.1 branched-chain amino acid aminotransferase [Paracoccus pantotrophus]SFY37826.1 branched-chain amino acid aminotransferase [Paracoccus pantotrophus]
MTPQSSASSQSYVKDPRNESVEIYVNGQFYKRDEAKVSIFDAGFVLGDGVWEGLRLVNGKLLAIDEHMDRIFEGARSIQLDIGLSKQGLVEEVWKCLRHNGMEDGVHIRLMISRGLKSTPNQDPRFVVAGATIVIVAEYKQPNPELKKKGLKLMTSTIRCSTPDVFDLRLNSHSRLNFIQALIQAINMGADEALMLDDRGFVASCNSTNFFIFRGDELWTSEGLTCFNGITRKKAIHIWREAGFTVREKPFTLAEVYSADEAFVTGTLGGITPVAMIDGRPIGDGKPGARTARINQLYQEYISQ